MESKPRIYAIMLLLTSVSLISCSDNETNIGNFGGFGNIPPPRNTDFEEKESFSSDVPVVNHTQLKLVGIAGNITVTGISGANSVMIEAIKRVQSDSTQDAKTQLQELKVNVQDLANEVRVETIQPIDGGGRKYIVDYTVTLPSFLKINVESDAGIVTLDSFENDVTVNNISGSVILIKILGNASVALLTGTIESDVTLPLNGTIDLRTLTGDISLVIPVNTSADFSATVSIGSINV